MFFFIDVDSTGTTSTLIPKIANENPDSHLLSVEKCEQHKPVTTFHQSQQQYPLTRKRSSTGSSQHLVRYRVQTSKKIVEERLRRRSWIVSQAQLLPTTSNCPNNMSTSTNHSQSPEILSQNQQTMNLLRLRRLRLGNSEPNLNSMQMNHLYQASPSLKSSPRISSTTTTDHSNPHHNQSNSTNLPLTSSQTQPQHYFPFPLRRPRSRRSILSGLNIMNLKYALRKQLSPQQQTLCASTSEPPDTTKSSSTFNPSSTSAFKPINDLDDSSNRRWSLTSAPSSSGYGTTTPITCQSHESSQYSSFERLQHQQQQHVCTCKQQTNLPNSNEGSLSNSSPHDDFIYGSLQRLESRSLSMSMLDANISSSPSKMMIMPDQDINSMAYIYKERYPKAKVQMEEGLQHFIDTYKIVDKYDYCSDGSARFIHNQIVELAKDCLEKSHEDLITTLYFNQMTNNLETLLLDTKDKCPQAINNLQTVVRKLLLTTARSARLLECLEFDPEDFLRTLDEVECQAKINGNIKQDIPKYICSKLNLERNPLDVIDGLQVNEHSDTEHQDTTDNKTNVGLSESESESFTDSNYLTITPNSTFPPIEHSLSTKTPCEDDFEVIKLISNGAYGAVHLVKHRQTQERYAMKKISKTHLILRNQVEQAFVERDIMTFTDNPFVVALICTFETKKNLCLVMEYVEGGDVATLLKNIGGPLNIDIARMYFAETTLAVEYLHSYGIIHRDLKPDNLLITAVGHIKLTDFGLSKIGLMSLTTNFYEKLLDKETKTFNDKQICGTPSYIAPEVILRQGYGKPVDWWSVGIILYEFLVGVPPFTGDTPDELFANVISGQIEWPDLLDESTIDLSSSTYYDSSEQFFCPEAKTLIERLLEHEPSNRLGTLGGAHEIRAHPFCACINWNTLLREKADFVPVLESPDDTSYFDTRQDRYQHSDDDILSSTTNKQTQVTLTDNDSDVLFASFSSVSNKYASELSGNHKQRHSSKTQHQDSTTTNTTASEMSSTDVSRTNSCSESFHPDSVIRINSPSGFQPLVMTQSMPTETSEKGKL
jgi:microtubule-associated serine/threonine kinase